MIVNMGICFRTEDVLLNLKFQIALEKVMEDVLNVFQDTEWRMMENVRLMIQTVFPGILSTIARIAEEVSWASMENV